ncbi:hypothetical protein LTR97_007282 [Elasticomyces elasticus]|uniref:Heterokaryon incompatibility domain-containing protein n=1 Tax=Elasticomyces elasticus TaxID=574655 RepID=A0AAN8A0S3_9PEZI|nr:hypothetical protein LTR97_007282 [Elasticomyces elasticus]
MRLLNVHTFRFEEYHNESDVPPYVVASHRWQAGTEAMIEDIELRRNTETKGYKKVEGFAKYIREHIVGVDWVWIDTCCVTQHSTKEVDEAVRSMFRWYANAYILKTSMDSRLVNGTRRGWTLQELLAPQVVIFLSQGWDVIGHKIDKACIDMHTLEIGPSLVPAIAEVTRIPESVLYEYEQSSKLTVEEKLTWTVGRDTMKGEDMYYSLLGIFGVDMRLSYGEGRVKAKARLLRKIAKSALASEPSTSTAQPTQQPRITPHRTAHTQYTGYENSLRDLECYIPFAKPERDYLSQTIVVLLGMGGIGKSEMVLQLIKNNSRTIHDRRWAVLWVDCNSSTSASTDFKRISTQYNWPVSEASMIVDTRDRLARLPEPALLVLDNCDDESVDYGSYIPHNLLVTVVLTTRLVDASKYASSDPQDSSKEHVIHLDGLTPDSAASLLMMMSDPKRRRPGDDELARKIVKALGFHPLAINVAGSLIRDGRKTFQEYATALEGQVIEGDDLSQKINATFEVSAQALAMSTHPSAKNALALLNILPYMHHQGISEQTFVRAWAYEEEVLSWYDEQGEFRYENDKNGGWKLTDASAGIAKNKSWRRALKKRWKKDVKEIPQERLSNPDLDIKHLSQWHVAKCREFLCSQPLKQKKTAFREARAHLARLSMITTNSDTNDPDMDSISVHLLITAWAKHRNFQRYEAWATAACVLALSTEGSGDWQPFSATLEPHLAASFSSFASSLEPDSEVNSSHRRQLCRIWYLYAWQLHQVENPQQINCCERLLEQTRILSVDGAGEEQVTEAEYLLAVVYQRNGRVVEALELLKNVVQARESLAVDHPTRLVSQHELARAYLANRQVTQAVELLEHVIRIRESLGEDHRSRLASQHELAHVYIEDGQVAPAVKLLEHVVWVREKSLAEDHPERLISQHELARAYSEDGQVARAVELLEHVVQVEERSLAQDHPKRLASQHKLACAYFDDKQTVRAVELLEHVVSVKQKCLAEDHVERLKSQYELGRAYREIGRYQEALVLIEHVVSVESKTLSVDDPSRMLSVDLLAYIQEESAELELEANAKASMQAPHGDVSADEVIEEGGNATGGAEASSQD